MAITPGTPNYRPSSIGRYEFAALHWWIGIIFGMYVCYAASEGDSMPFEILEPIKSLGLFIFRSQYVLKLVFWAAVVAHVYETFLAAFIFARRVRPDIPFVAFWLVQTLILGFPSLRLIKEQRRKQRKQEAEDAVYKTSATTQYDTEPMR